jgi:hypothetical protein
MSVETLLKTAAYFEDRARRTRQSEERERLLAVASKYRERAAAARHHQPIRDSELSPPSR